MEKIFFRSDAICETLRNGRLVRRVQVILSCRRVWGCGALMSFLPATCSHLPLSLCASRFMRCMTSQKI